MLPYIRPVSLNVSKLLQIIGQIFAFNRRVYLCTDELATTKFGLKKLKKHCSTVWSKTHLDSLNLLCCWITSVTDGQTDSRNR